MKWPSRNLALKGFNPESQVNILSKTIWIKPCWASWPWRRQTVWLSELHLSKVSSCLRWDYIVHLIPREGILCALINSRCMTQHPRLHLGKASVPPLERKVVWKFKGGTQRKERWNNFVETLRYSSGQNRPCEKQRCLGQRCLSPGRAGRGWVMSPAAAAPGRDVQNLLQAEQLQVLHQNLLHSLV